MRLLFAGGGTAGHINPALAIANYFCEKEPSCEVRFVGTREGLETGLVPRSGYPLEFIKVHGFARSLTAKNIKNLLELPGAVHEANKIIKNFRPDAVIGTGGYVCGPVLYAAARRGIPTLIHESNAYPGVTTRLLANHVDVVALGVEDAKKYLSKAKNIRVTGTPLRSSLLEVTPAAARHQLGLDDRPFLVFFGGSLGARDFNRTVADWIAQNGAAGRYQILMATGKRNHYEEVMQHLEEMGVALRQMPHVKICEYIYNMDVVMAAANLLICRAGASTLCELTALGKASVLVPSPYVTGNHQEHNARAVERGGGAVVLTEDEFTPHRLDETVRRLVTHEDVLKTMERHAAQMGHLDALDVLYHQIKDLIE